jgi:hypothetical protein
VFNFDEQVAPWIGRSGDDALRAWGAPASEVALGSGRRILIYVQETKIDPGKRVECRQDGAGINDARCVVSGDNSFTLGCRTDFELSAAGAITTAKRRGDLCPAASLPSPPPTGIRVEPPVAANTEVASPNEVGETAPGPAEAGPAPAVAASPPAMGATAGDTGDLAAAPAEVAPAEVGPETGDERRERMRRLRDERIAKRKARGVKN